MTKHSFTLTVHRAESFFSRLAGLLARPALACEEALYLSPCSSVHTWFMRYDIDVVFLDRSGRVLKVVADVVPWRMLGCRRAHAVLELCAGQAARAGIGVGMSLARLLGAQGTDRDIARGVS